MHLIWKWKRETMLFLVSLVMYRSDAITAGTNYRLQHQQPILIPGGVTNGAAVRWHPHAHRSPVMVTRVHRSGSSAANHYHHPAMSAGRYRAPPPIGPVKRVYLPYKYLPQAFPHKIRYAVPGTVHAKRQALPPGWKPKRNVHLGHSHNNYLPSRRIKHPGKYLVKSNKGSQNSLSSNVVTDSYSVPYKLTSTTYGVPHPTQGAPEPPQSSTSNTLTSSKEVPTSFIQVYQGNNNNNNREVETKTSYAFNTHHQHQQQQQHKAHHQMTSAQIPQQQPSSTAHQTTHQSLARPIKIKSNPSPTISSYHEAANNNLNDQQQQYQQQQPVYRPTATSSTINISTAHNAAGGGAAISSGAHHNHQQLLHHHHHHQHQHKFSSKEVVQPQATSTNTYGAGGGFQPPKQTYGFQPYDEKDLSSSSSSINGISTSLSSSDSSNNNYYPSNTNGQTASTASISSSSSGISSPTHLTREDYLSPSYYNQQKT